MNQYALPPKDAGWIDFKVLPQDEQKIWIWMYGVPFEMTWKIGPVPSFMVAWKNRS